MNPRTHEEIQELLGVYALHAADADEVAAVEAHLEGCPRCRAEVAGHREVATLLGNSGGDAPDGLWDRIASQLEETPPPMRLSLPEGIGDVIPLAPRRRERGNRIVVAALGAAAALAIAVLGAQVVRQQDRLDEMESAVEEGYTLAAANVALRDPDALKTELTSFDGDLSGTAVILPNGTGFLLAHELDALVDGGTYQLWGKTESGLISLGLLGDEVGAVLPFQAGESVSGLAITAEDAGGVLQSQNPAVLSGDFD